MTRGMDIPMADLTAQVRELEEELLAEIRGVLRSGSYILGPQVRAFESEMADYLGAAHAVGVNSGTDALLIALRAAGIGPGDEVITTPFTFFATAEAISLTGATPRFVDVDPETFNIDVAKVQAEIRPTTRGLVPVHLFGLAADMTPLLKIAADASLVIVEDVAQALGGTYEGRKLGTFGSAAAFSFFPSKNLGALGDGGLVTTDDAGIAERIRMLRAHGAKKKYHNEVLGYNSRLDEIQAAILRVKLRGIDRANAQRREVARRYSQLLVDVPFTKTPDTEQDAHVYHQYTIRVMKGHRDRVASGLKAAGIASAVYYPVPVHRLPIYQDGAPDLRIAEALSSEVLSLPIWPEMDEPTQDRVVAEIRSILSD